MQMLEVIRLEPLFLKPVFKERIWGGTTLKKKFGYDIPTDHTGECWGISAHPNGPSIIENGPICRYDPKQALEGESRAFWKSEGRCFSLINKDSRCEYGFIRSSSSQ